MWWRCLRDAASRPVDAAGLAAFRIAFSALLIIGTLRFWQKGAIREAFVRPAFFFPHYGFGWLTPLPGHGMYVVYAAMAAAALALLAGARTRLAAALFCLLFTYAHVLDLTNYLNHYYLVTLITALMAWLPVGAAWSMDAIRAPEKHGGFVPAWVLWLFRFQIGVAYVFAGVAKLQHDWLFEAQPLRLWLAASTDVPVLGAFFSKPWTAFAMSWMGAAYDLTVPFLLLWRRARPFAYAAVVIFHLVTAKLFQIGMFPYFMIAASLLFLEPSWPRRLLRVSCPAPRSVAPLRPAAAAVVLAFVVVQIFLPLRHFLYPGSVLWTEQGFRFAWHVMVIEKTGSAEFMLVDRKTGAKRAVRVLDHLTPWQTKAMSTQPDMILAFAHRLAELERRQGRDVMVLADVLVVLNGRAPARLVDPAVDLSREEEGFGAKAWVLPAP